MGEMEGKGKMSKQKVKEKKNISEKASQVKRNQSRFIDESPLEKCFARRAVGVGAQRSHNLETENLEDIKKKKRDINGNN